MQYVRESDNQLHFYVQLADKQLTKVYNMQYVRESDSQLHFYRQFADKQLFKSCSMLKRQWHDVFGIFGMNRTYLGP